MHSFKKKIDEFDVIWDAFHKFDKIVNKFTINSLFIQISLALKQWVFGICLCEWWWYDKCYILVECVCTTRQDDEMGFVGWDQTRANQSLISCNCKPFVVQSSKWVPWFLVFIYIPCTIQASYRYSYLIWLVSIGSNLQNIIKLSKSLVWDWLNCIFEVSLSLKS